MSGSSLKTYFLVLLVIVNAVFAFALLTDILTDVNAESTVLHDLADIFKSSGIELAADAFTDTHMNPQSVRVVRSADAEQRLAERLLGPGTIGKDLGGSMFFYTGMSGVARFRLDGTFEIQLPFYSSSSKSLASLAEDLAATMGLRVRKIAENGGSLLYAVLRGDSEIINQQLDFEFDDKSGVVVSGVNVAGSEQPGDEYDYADTLTASLKFLREIEAGGILCGKVSRVQSVYLFASSAYIPAWRFECDSGTYILNSVSGELATTGYSLLPEEI